MFLENGLLETSLNDEWSYITKTGSDLVSIDVSAYPWDQFEDFGFLEGDNDGLQF